MSARRIPRLLFRVLPILVAGSVCFAPWRSAHVDETHRNASIKGCITIDGAGAAGIKLVLRESATSGRAAQQREAKTDREGCYRFSGLAAGEYDLSIYAPVYTVDQANRLGSPGRTVTVSDSEEFEGVDFRLVRGGVITGRVKKIDGEPVIAERVVLYNLSEKVAGATPVISSHLSIFETDDRGVYRVFGVPKGRYLVSVGNNPDAGVRLPGTARPFFPRIFHPNVQDESAATVIEVLPGREATNVDITIGDPLKTFSISGRIVDLNTKSPVPMVEYTCTAFKPGQGPVGTTFWEGRRSDAKGSFRIDGLAPGSYVVFTRAHNKTAYSEPTFVEVTGDISELEIGVLRSASISGTVIYEGPPDVDIAEKLQRLEIGIGVKPRNSSMLPQSFKAKVELDGSFQITGISSGTASFGITRRGGGNHLSIAAIQRGGVLLTGPLQIASGEHIEGIRLILGSSDGGVKGQVVVKGGELPAGTRMLVFVRKTGNKASGDGGLSEVDAKGSFLIYSLSMGEYELILTSLPSGGKSVFPPVKQIIDVTPSGVTEVKLELNLSSKKELK